MKRHATAVWKGALKNGLGKLSSESSVLNETPYSFGSRFESGVGTNPEELIAAAHAGCFAMAFASELGKAGMEPQSIEAKATITLDILPSAGPTVTNSHLEVTATVPQAEEKKVLEVAELAKVNCPISRLLQAKVTMDVKARV